MSDELIICRCEEVSLKALEEAMAEGVNTAHALKLLTRAGMGFCQGRTCRGLIEALLAGSAGRIHGANPSPMSYRLPVRPVPLAVLARCGEGGEQP